MFIFPDLGGATPNHRLAFPGEGKEVQQKLPLLQKHAQQLLREQPRCCCPQQLTFRLTFPHLFLHLFSKHLLSYTPDAVLGANQDRRGLCPCGIHLWLRRQKTCNKKVVAKS